jgi:hypothetical protein
MPAQIASVNAAIDAKRDFWIAQADLDMALIGKPSLAAVDGCGATAGPAPKPPAPDIEHEGLPKFPDAGCSTGAGAITAAAAQRPSARWRWPPCPSP